ncbi:ATP-binding protein [Actinophytocola sp.]|uniref:ATP-binding protein n=1 Tax=Actinophytocola sp. TaxID=1872138 RepID=UPI003D6C2272
MFAVTLGLREPARLLGEVRFTGVDPDFLTGVRRWLEAPLRGCTKSAVLGAAVVVGELTTNAFRHARPPFAVRLILPERRNVIRLEVHDATAPPAMDWSPGRGLDLVRALCLVWGVDHRDSGKVVWAELPLLVRPIVG